jgi:hypothetical protein
MLRFTFRFISIILSVELNETNKIWYNEIPWTHLQVLFESLSSTTEIKKLATMRNFEVMLEQTLICCCVDRTVSDYGLDDLAKGV